MFRRGPTNFLLLPGQIFLPQVFVYPE